MENKRQLIENILSKLKSVENFFEFINLPKNNKLISKNESGYKFNYLTISVDEYAFKNELLIHILNIIINEILDDENIKTHRILDDEIYNSIYVILHEKYNLKWFASYNNFLTISSILNEKRNCNYKYTQNDKCVIEFGEYKINILETFIPNFIFGMSEPVKIISNKFEIRFKSGFYHIKIPYYINNNNLHNIYIVSDENEKKLIIRNKKINKLNIK